MRSSKILKAEISNEDVKEKVVNKGKQLRKVVETGKSYSSINEIIGNRFKKHKILSKNVRTETKFYPLRI